MEVSGRQRRAANMTDTCPMHAAKVIEYYCKAHNKTGCTACVMVDHRSCPEVNYIPDIAKGIADSQECKDKLKSLNELTDKLNSIKLQTSHLIDDMQKASVEYTQAVQAYRDELVVIIDRHAADAELTKQKYVDDVINQLKSAQTLSQDHLDIINSSHSDITNKIQAVNESSLFLLLKKAESVVNDCNKLISKFQNSIFVKPCMFEKNRKLFSELSNAGSIGKLVTESYPYLCAEINTKTHTDSKTCDIWGMDILADGRLLVGDCNNGAVKLYNTDHTLAVRVPLPSPPTDIAAVSGEEVVVSMPLNKTVQFLSVSDTLTPGRVVQTAVPCRSVVAYGDKLVACTRGKPGTIVKLDMGGRRVATIWTCPGGYTRYVRRLPNDTLCVSHDGGVTCLTLDGEVVGEYTADNLSWPRGITQHRDGSFYVCGRQSDNIHHVSPECNQIDVLSQRKVVNPYAMCYNHVDNILYVAEDKKNMVKVVRLKPC